MLKNNIVLVPEVSDKRGALYNLRPNENRDQWIVDLKVRIGNDDRTAKGGNGLGFFYLKDINTQDLGQGTFGYSQ